MGAAARRDYCWLGMSKTPPQTNRTRTWTIGLMLIIESINNGSGGVLGYYRISGQLVEVWDKAGMTARMRYVDSISRSIVW